MLGSSKTYFMQPKVIGKIDLDNSTTTKDVTVRRHGRMINFYVPWSITSEQALILQENLGYIPAGYGFYGFTHDPENGTHWACGDSCD